MKQPKDADGNGLEDPLPNCTSEPWGWTNGNGNAYGHANGNNGNGHCGGNAVGAGPELFEKDQYYFHPDHLGSSSYITDIDGEVFQHLEYFPFGETFVEESSNTQRTPYLFTGKELDEETGLYYFGARYYDPRTSVWQSPDPILARYFPEAGMEPEAIRELPSAGGIFDPANLALYGYSKSRPVVLVDPDGNAPLSKKRFMSIIGETNDRVAGQRFEEAMLESLWYAVPNPVTFPSRYRAQRTKGRRFGVKPDAVGIVPGTRPGGRLPKPDLDSLMVEIIDFAEIKLTNRKSLPLSFNKYQLAGMIDVLASKPLRKGGVRPTLAVVTTSDTRLGPSLYRYARKRGVALVHVVAQESWLNQGMVYTGTDVTMQNGRITVTLPGSNVDPNER